VRPGPAYSELPSKGNHTGYRQTKGTKTSADDIWELYQGLKQSYLDDFDMMLSGYLPSPEAIEIVGKIGRELKLRRSTKPGAFFWGWCSIPQSESTN
jgi:pyridoxine kinase